MTFGSGAARRVWHLIQVCLECIPALLSKDAWKFPLCFWKGAHTSQTMNHRRKYSPDKQKIWFFKFQSAALILWETNFLDPINCKKIHLRTLKEKCFILKFHTHSLRFFLYITQGKFATIISYFRVHLLKPIPLNLWLHPLVSAGSPEISLHNEWSVRAVERLGGSWEAGRRRLPRVRRGQGPGTFSPETFFTIPSPEQKEFDSKSQFTLLADLMSYIYTRSVHTPSMKFIFSYKVAAESNFATSVTLIHWNLMLSACIKFT